MTQSTITIPAASLDLQPGERYAGLTLDASTGQPTHHVILLPARPERRLNWQQAMDWAAQAGGTLPTRQEQALLFASCKPQLQPRWHWSSETDAEDASSAWGCSFLNGNQSNNLKSFEACAVAVRLIPITA